MVTETEEQPRELEQEPSHWAACPRCGVERTDWEFYGRHLPECPNCLSLLNPVIELYVVGLDWTERYHHRQPDLSVVEMVLSLAEQTVQAEVFNGYVVSDAQKWELRDAIQKLIDERIDAKLTALKAR